MNLKGFSFSHTKSGIQEIYQDLDMVQRPFVIFCDSICSCDKSSEGANPVEIAEKSLTEYLSNVSVGGIDETVMVKAFEYANKKLLQTFEDREESIALSCIVLALTKKDDSQPHILVAGAGDSRLYEIDNNKASLAFFDPYAADVSSHLTPADRLAELQNALGISTTIKIHCKSFLQTSFHRFVLLSYGLYEHLTEEDIVNFGLRPHDLTYGVANRFKKIEEEGHALRTLTISLEPNAAIKTHHLETARVTRQRQKNKFTALALSLLCCAFILFFGYEFLHEEKNIALKAPPPRTNNRSPVASTQDKIRPTTSSLIKALKEQNRLLEDENSSLLNKIAHHSSLLRKLDSQVQEYSNTEPYRVIENLKGVMQEKDLAMQELKKEQSDLQQEIVVGNNKLQALQEDLEDERQHVKEYKFASQREMSRISDQIQALLQSKDLLEKTLISSENVNDPEFYRLKAIIDEKNEMLGNMQNDLFEREELLKKKENEVQTLAREFNKQEKLLKKLELLSNEKSQQSEEIQKQVKYIHALQAKLDQEREKKQKIENNMAQLSHNYERTQSLLSATQSERRALYDEIEHITSAVTRQEKALLSEKERYSTLQNSYNTQLSKNNEIQTLLHNFKKENKQLEESLAHQTSQHESAVQEKRQLQSMAESMENHQNELRQEIEKLSGLYQQAKADLEKQTLENSTLHAKLSTVTQDLENKKERLATVSQDIESTKKTLASLQTEQADMLQKYGTLKSAHEKLLEEKDLADQHIATLEHHHEDINTQLESLRNSKYILEKESQENKTLTSQLAEKEKLLEQLHQEIATANDKYTKQTQSLNEIVVQRDALQDELQKAEEFRQDKEDMLVELQKTKQSEEELMDMTNNLRASLYREVETLTQKYEQTQQAKLDLEKALAQSQAALEEQNLRNDKIVAEKEQGYKKLLATREQELKELLSKKENVLSEKEQAYQNIQDLYDNLAEKAENMKEQHEDLQARNQELRHIETKQKDLLAELKQSKKHEQELLDLTDHLRDSLYQEVEALTEKYDTIQKDKAEMEKALAKSKAVIQDKEKAYQQIQDFYDIMTKNIDSLKNENKKLRQENNSVIASQKKVEEKERYLKEMISNLQQQNEKIMSLESSREDLLGELNKIKSDYSSVQQVLPTPKKSSSTLTPIDSSQDLAELIDSNMKPSYQTEDAVQHLHIVSRGDSLTSISQKYYGTAKRWKEIYDANSNVIPNKNQVKIGTVLIIP